MEETSKISPFYAEIVKITTFDKGKYGYPVIAEVKSNELISFRNKLKKIFDNNKIKYDNKFPEYKPHITLGYSQEKISNIKIDKFKFPISQISLYGGDEHDERLFINFPFSLSIKKSSRINLLSEIFLKNCQCQ